MMFTSRRGAPTWRMIAVAATGSVGETIAPSAKASGHESPIASCADHGDGPDRHEHQADRRHRDRAQVAAQRAQVREEGGRVQQRRQEDQEDQIGLELDLRDARKQTEHQPAQHERDRIGHRQPARDHVQARDRHEQRRQDDLEILHGGIVSAIRGTHEGFAAPLRDSIWASAALILISEGSGTTQVCPNEPERCARRDEDRLRMQRFQQPSRG